MENSTGLDANDKELRFQNTSHSEAGHLTDVSGVLRNDIIIKALRAAREKKGLKKSFPARRKWSLATDSPA